MRVQPDPSDGGQSEVGDELALLAQHLSDHANSISIISSFFIAITSFFCCVVQERCMIFLGPDEKVLKPPLVCFAQESATQKLKADVDLGCNFYVQTEV